ncbi:unnamed protein product [Polarella glacialis]|uniref:PsbP C-terminal domain-containing protein n=1 Tax=Polarella glacialis TaxID=89957 RepID=A0A813DDA0_POLGL|nr:unnamed protein product [Polarella glacialis]
MGAHQRALRSRRPLFCVRKSLLCSLLCCTALHLLLASLSLRAFSAQPHPHSSSPEEGGGRREAVLLLSAAATTAALSSRAEPAAAMQGQNTGKTETIVVPANPKVGNKAYIFEKPAGFKRFASPIDPSGYIFRSVNDTYFTFVTRVESRPNASTDFRPEAFIDDYTSKFVNATGSSFTLVRGGGNPNRVDVGLGVQYFEIEYVVRTQLGFSFDSLRSLHFITTFAVSKDSIAILNCQAPDEMWEKDAPVLRRITESFKITS